jgi:MraZ protein
MVIADRFDHSIDEKNRLAIPSSFRNAMNPETDGTAFYLVPESRYLQLIPEKLFQSLASRSAAGLALSPEDAKARRLIFATASRLEPDKQGRVIIPDRFMADGKNRDPFTEALLGHEVTLVGASDRIELWNRQDFLNHMRELLADRGSLQGAMQRLFGPPTPPADAQPA